VSVFAVRQALREWMKSLPVHWGGRGLVHRSPPVTGVALPWYWVDPHRMDGGRSVAFFCWRRIVIGNCTGGMLVSCWGIFGIGDWGAVHPGRVRGEGVTTICPLSSIFHKFPRYLDMTVLHQYFIDQVSITHPSSPCFPRVPRADTPEVPFHASKRQQSSPTQKKILNDASVCESGKKWVVETPMG